MKIRSGRLITALLPFFLSNPLQALEFQTSGFASLITGKVLSGEKGDYLERVSGYECPCFIADYPNAGVYDDNGWDFTPDSRAGVQFNLLFNDTFEFTTQIVGHGGDDMKPELSAFYLGYKISEKLSVDLGRQRLPLFYYSDFYDVGYAYPWIRVPGDLYGWPINSYNGISMTYSDNWGDGTYEARIWSGQEEENDNRDYAKIYYASNTVTTHWKDMAGGSLAYFYEWLDLRAVYMSNRSYNAADYGVANGGIFIDSNYFRQEFVGLAANVDYHNVLIKVEYNQFDIFKTDFNSKGKLVSLGYRMGTFTPTVAYSHYDDFDPSFGEAESSMTSLGVRWDFRDSMDFKMQYDIISDAAKWIEDDTTIPITYYKNFIGDTKTLSMGVDYVF